MPSWSPKARLTTSGFSSSGSTTADPVASEGWRSSQIAMVRRLMPHVRQFIRVRQALVRAQAGDTTVTALLKNPRIGVLHLEVKGDSCHDIRRMLTELDRGGDYIELSLDGRPTWNPLSATWRDSYSLASPVASRLNQLFGNGKEPFGQPA